MQTSSILNPKQALRGLRTFALGAFASAVFGTGAYAFPVSLLSNSDFTVGDDGLTGWTTTQTPAGAIIGGGAYSVEGPGQVLATYEGYGPFNVDFNHSITLGPVLQTAVLSFNWSEYSGSPFGTAPATFSVQVVDATNTVVATLYTATAQNIEARAGRSAGRVANGLAGGGSASVSIDVAAILNTLPVGNYTFRFDNYVPASFNTFPGIPGIPGDPTEPGIPTGPISYPSYSQVTISALSFTAEVGNSVIFQKGDTVPGMGKSKFTAFGTPAINAGGTVAVFAKWTGSGGRGAGIFVGGELVAKVGDEVPAGSGVKIRWLLDPVLDDAGHVAIPALLTGTGITSLNDDAILSNACGALAIVAQQGKQAPGAPEGAQWKTLSSVAASGNGGVVILGYMAQGPGGITAANDNGLWAAGADGVLHLLLQEGVTNVGGKTVKNFAVLKSVAGTPGQTHAFNSSGELVSKVTFTDGSQAVVHTPLP